VLGRTLPPGAVGDAPPQVIVWTPDQKRAGGSTRACDVVSDGTQQGSGEATLVSPRRRRADAAAATHGHDREGDQLRVALRATTTGRGLTFARDFLPPAAWTRLPACWAWTPEYGTSRAYTNVAGQTSRARRTEGRRRQETFPVGRHEREAAPVSENLGAVTRAQEGPVAADYRAQGVRPGTTPTYARPDRGSEAPRVRPGNSGLRRSPVAPTGAGARVRVDPMLSSGRQA